MATKLDSTPRARKWVWILVLTAPSVIAAGVIGRPSSLPAAAAPRSTPAATALVAPVAIPVAVPRRTRRVPVPRKAPAPPAHPTEASPSEPALACDELLAMWRRESPDADWSENVRGYFDRLFDAADAGARTVDKVECRSTVCRVELRTPPLVAAQQARALAESDQYPFEFRIVPGDAGTNRVEIFLRRTAAEQAAL